MSLTPSGEQQRAIDQIVKWYERGGSEFYMAGYAGVGKSTVCKMAIEALKGRGRNINVCTATFTGKAANVLRQKGVADARTIHSATYRPSEVEETSDNADMFKDEPPPRIPGEKRKKTVWSIAKDGPASKADLIVLDEVSMVNLRMADDLRSFNKPILVMGDPGQLPPVKGAGAFTNREPDILLETIHRQAADSPILKLATMARMGETIPFGDYGPDVSVKPLRNGNVACMYDLDAQVLCGVHRVRWKSTQMIRSQLGYRADLPLPGERIICRRNNVQRGIFNGSMGKLISMHRSPSGNGVWLLAADMEYLEFPISEVPVDPYLFFEHGGTKAPEGYDPPRWLDVFDWGWVLTCHQSQGSEWPNIVVVDDGHFFGKQANRWRYTAITRSQKKLTILRRS